MTACGESNTDRPPVRAAASSEPTMRERHATYEDATNLDELLSCLTCHSYKSRQKRQSPLLFDLFASPVLHDTDRFENVSYRASALDETNDMVAAEDRDLVMRDIPYEAEEIPDYNERRFPTKMSGDSRLQ